jgi:uncharacterized protein YpmB
MFQNLIVFLVVIFSAIYLANKLFRQFFSKSESCEGCAIGKSSNSVDLKKPS